MSKILKIVFCCLLCSLNVAAQEGTTDSIGTQEGKRNLMGRLRQVQQYLDNKARKSVDPQYIEVPEKPWRIILRYNSSYFDVDYSNSAGDISAGEGIEWNLCLAPPLGSSIGIWAGYRGTGIALSRSLRKKKGNHVLIQYHRSKVRSQYPTEGI